MPGEEYLGLTTTSAIVVYGTEKLQLTACGIIIDNGLRIVNNLGIIDGEVVGILEEVGRHEGTEQRITVTSKHADHIVTGWHSPKHRYWPVDALSHYLILSDVLAVVGLLLSDIMSLGPGGTKLCL